MRSGMRERVIAPRTGCWLVTRKAVASWIGNSRPICRRKLSCSIHSRKMQRDACEPEEPGCRDSPVRCEPQRLPAWWAKLVHRVLVQQAMNATEENQCEGQDTSAAPEAAGLCLRPSVNSDAALCEHRVQLTNEDRRIRALAHDLPAVLARSDHDASGSRSDVAARHRGRGDSSDRRTATCHSDPCAMENWSCRAP